MAPRRITLVSALALLTGVATIANCSSNPAASGSSGGSGDAGATPFQPDPPSVYVAKVKNILVGLPPTDDEVKKVTADPSQLAALIDGWMQTPEYTQKMMIFFELAFQQTQITPASFIDMIAKNGIGPGAGVPPLVQNIRESFARTVLALIAEGKPLSEAMTTKRFMMTPPLMEFYAFLDTWHVDDDAKITDSLVKDNPAVTKIYQGTAGLAAVPLSETLDPKSPNYMHWYSADVAKAVYKTDPSCTGIDPIVYPPNSLSLHWILYGAIDNHPGPNGNCGGRSGNGVQFTPADFSAWKMITIRPPQGNEAITRFFDIPALRTATELVVTTPRPGFFSTPAFFANWSTNQSNQMRVTLNQALIVATGMSIDGTDPTTPTMTPGIDPAHAPPGSACFGCHQTLDPTRAILASTWTYPYYTQKDPALIAEKGLFAFQGVIKPVSNIDDFATILATHPALPTAWAQKLCYYVNSAPCAPDDPEFQRVVGVFQSANLSWSALVKGLLSSPLTTNASPTKTTAGGAVIAVARRDHLCAALNNRLGLVDICGLDVGTPPSVVSRIVGGLPSDGYGRGSTIPVLPNQPSLFYRAGLENICEAVANIVIDTPPDPKTPNAKRWTGKSPDAAIADFVATLMAITPSDPRSAPAQAALKAHFTDAMQKGSASSADALRSTFTAACLAPSSAGIGM